MNELEYLYYCQLLPIISAGRPGKYEFLLHSWQSGHWCSGRTFTQRMLVLGVWGQAGVHRGDEGQSRAVGHQHRLIRQVLGEGKGILVRWLSVSTQRVWRPQEPVFQVRKFWHCVVLASASSFIEGDIPLPSPSKMICTDLPTWTLQNRAQISPFLEFLHHAPASLRGSGYLRLFMMPCRYLS